MSTARARQSLPPKIAYYRRHLLAGRFRVVPGPGDMSRQEHRLMLPKAALLRAPESPAFREVLLASKEPVVSGWIVAGALTRLLQ